MNVWVRVLGAVIGATYMHSNHPLPIPTPTHAHSLLSGYSVGDRYTYKRYPDRSWIPKRLLAEQLYYNWIHSQVRVCACLCAAAASGGVAGGAN